MKTKFLILLLSCSCSVCFAQETIKQDSVQNKKNNVQHNLFMELGGGLMFYYYYNITYDCSFVLAEKHKISIATGIQHNMPPIPYFGVLTQVNYLYGKKNHHLEIGTGVNCVIAFYRPHEPDEWKWDMGYGFVIPVRIGYRYQRKEGGLFWKIAFVPSVTPFGDFSITPNAGVAIGYTFKNKKR